MKMILFKHTWRLLFVFILAFSLGTSEIKAQDLSIVTTLTSPVSNTPQTAGATLTYDTTVFYSDPLFGVAGATIALNFSGMALATTISIGKSNSDAGFQLAAISATLTNNVYSVAGFQDGYSIKFTYTCVITSTNSSAVNNTTVAAIGYSELTTTNNINVVQTFIKPILNSPSDITICSGKPVDATLAADNPYSLYAWTPTSSTSTLTVTVQGPIDGNNIQDIISNTGNTVGTVLYTVTPRIVAPTISLTGTIGPVSTTTSGDPKTFNVTVRAPSRIISVSVTGNGVIYSNENAVFTPNSDLASATYAWYGSMDKTNFITNGVLTESNLSAGTHTFYVTATDINSCDGPVFPVTVTVLPLPVNPRKDFTPNDDGIEDTWIINDIGEYPKCSIRVFDIWGGTVYSSTGYSTPWNGTFHNTALPVATYYYVIDLNDGSRPISGSVAIIR